MIVIRNLSFFYSGSGKKIVGLRNIALHIRKEERVAIIGPSGAGKSTLLRCINRLLDPEGRIEIEGEDIVNCQEGKARRIRSKIAMIFQDYNLIKRSLTIDNVLAGRLSYVPLWRRYLYGFNYSRDDYARALNSLRRVQIGNLAYRRVDNLSGGQQQRVGIARALAQEPKIVLADEPVSSLDPKNKKEIMDLLSSICDKRGITLLISMHEVDLVKQYVTRVIGIRNAEIVFDNKPEKLTRKEHARIYN